MYVQAFDKFTERYYKSVVYAIIRRKSAPVLNIPEALCHDEELAVLFNPITNCIELLPQFEDARKLVAGVPTRVSKLNYTIIQPDRAEWKALDKNQTEQYTNERVVSVVGYPEIIEQHAIIRRLFADRRIDIRETNIRIRIPEDSDEWTYVLTQEDADKLTASHNNFHDAVIDQIHYTETDSRAFMATVTVLTGDKKTLCLCFEGVIALNLRTQIEWQREMAFASLNVDNRSITWVVDESAQCLPDENTGIRALSLKWRVME